MLLCNPSAGQIELRYGQLAVKSWLMVTLYDKYLWKTASVVFHESKIITGVVWFCFEFLKKFVTMEDA